MPLDFNSHTREGVTPFYTNAATQQRISTHTPVRVWPPAISCIFMYVGISTHTPVRVWRHAKTWDDNLRISTHTPVRVWLHQSIVFTVRQIISTHTPVRVWQSQAMTCFHQDKISTHTPVRVWHIIRCRLSDTAPYFNSHTREGVTNSRHLLNYFINISTHTPVRVWQYACKYIPDVKHFNSHTREGVTIFEPIPTCLLCLFQLTHPWGCDVVSSHSSSASLIFQLTHPWGCDLRPLSSSRRPSAFQLTHPWGCDCFDRVL